MQKRNKCVALKHLSAVEAAIEKHAEKIVCIGEVDEKNSGQSDSRLGCQIGLDHAERYRLTSEEKDEQREVFVRQLRMAERLRLPV